MKLFIQLSASWQLNEVSFHYKHIITQIIAYFVFKNEEETKQKENVKQTNLSLETLANSVKINKIN